MTDLEISRTADGKAAGWKQRSDRGPHVATLPSGQEVTFRIPDSGQLIRSGRLPEDLKRMAKLVALHPGGPEGYMDDLLAVAIRQGTLEETLERSIDNGIELGYHLIAEMVESPAITVDDVRSGELPELDVKMLLEFAERKRNTDAAGNKLPILTLDEWATFRGQPQSGPGVGDGEAPVGEPDEPVPGPGGDQV